MPVVLCRPDYPGSRRGLLAKAWGASLLLALAIASLGAWTDRLQAGRVQRQLQAALDVAVAETLISAPEADDEHLTKAVRAGLSAVGGETIALSLTRDGPHRVQADVTVRLATDAGSGSVQMMPVSTVVTLQKPSADVEQLACCATGQPGMKRRDSVRAAARDFVQLH